MTPITQFQGMYRWLSNFWPVYIEYEGRGFPSVEHAYQAAKLKPEAREPFQSVHMKAGEAKRLGRGKEPADWKERNLGIMLDLLRLKFQDAKLRKSLLDTKDIELIEGNNWNDTFWGVCRGVGQNNLGKLLMQVRSELHG